MFVALGTCVFNRVRLRQAEHAGTVRPLTDLSAHQVPNTLRWRVYPTVLHLIAGKHPASDLFKLRQRLDTNRSGVYS